MFENLNWWEIAVLILLALLIFGDRLPQVIQDGLRMIRSLRNMARDATGDLSRELGTDIQLEDLHPKAFIRKHLLSEEDEAALRNPIQGLVESVKKDVTGINDELKDVAAAVDPRRPAPAPSVPAATPANKPAAFDFDAT
ncbi:sec-independent protein translocase protein TatB [Catenuloplanes nepalensis]|uniref:Sec-independent protein translocase protein TatB n=1 Tax=Catenuloplanes nepalensis TaxID=587533 RepID=A0ABT9N2P7_9ACTN|nr:preprotein translocase subunit TatB [Catenuloplanes nepalensis]MDP9797957.1 sec-independent protein translocase protein TatB [Catenuloplanes nepalensis]